VKSQAPLQLVEPEALEVADTVCVDLQCFAVSKRQVESFCETEDVPLPPELALLQPSCELKSKIDSGEFCSPHPFRFVIVRSVVCGHSCCSRANCC
jgi:hypothetical protein